MNEEEGSVGQLEGADNDPINNDSDLVDRGDMPSEGGENVGEEIGTDIDGPSEIDDDTTVAIDVEEPKPSETEEDEVIEGSDEGSGFNLDNTKTSLSGPDGDLKYSSLLITKDPVLVALGELADESGWDTDIDDVKSEEGIAPNTRHRFSGSTIYLETCEDLGIVPVSYFLRHLNDSVFVMRHHGLGALGARALAAPLATNTTILLLDLEDNWQTADGAFYICETLKENCYITDLNLSDNKLGSVGAKIMCNMLQANSTLIRVNISGNEFADKDAPLFAEMLKVNFRLKELELSRNHFSDAGAEELGIALAANDSLEFLNLSWNMIRPRGGSAIGDGLKLNISLKKLDISWNGISNEGLLAICEALKFNNSLLELDITSNRITLDGIQLLLRGLETNDTLEVLHLGYNSITSYGCELLVSTIKDYTNSNMREIHLTGIEVAQTFLVLLAEIPQTCKKRSFIVTHGPVLGFAASKPIPDPLTVMVEHLQKRRLRIVDFFKCLDKDKNMVVCKKEFMNGIEAMKIPLTKKQQEKLLERLDVDSNGVLDFSELVSGYNSVSRKPGFDNTMLNRRR